jgi:cell division GTPase FtsZ
MENQSNSFVVIAVGSGATIMANYISEIADEANSKNKINMLAVDTKKDDLQSSCVENKILIQDINDIEELKNGLYPHLINVKVAVIFATLGGKTGTTLAPQILKLLHEQHIIPLCIVTTPFKFERRESRALNCIEHMSEYHPALVRWNNEFLREEMGNISISDAFLFVNKKIADLIFALKDAFARENVSSIISILQEGKEYEVDDFTQIVKSPFGVVSSLRRC